MIRGTVQSVLFQNPENGYSVLKLRTEDGELVTVVGTIQADRTREEYGILVLRLEDVSFD